MNISKLRRLLFFTILSFLGGYGLLLSTIPFLGLGWHLLHGNFIAYNGWRIPVPRGFYVSGSPEQPTMWKHTLGIPLLKRPFGMIGIRPRPSGASFQFGSDLEDSSARMIAAARQEGLALRSKRTLSTGIGNAFCFEFSNSNEQSQITVRCAINDTSLLVIYGGDEKFLFEFYSAVQGLSGERLAGSPR